jgi:spermidine/putrescine transport system ATP-binding protein
MPIEDWSFGTISKPAPCSSETGGEAMATSTDKIVEFKGVSKSFSKFLRPALEVEELSIMRGEFFSVLGPSGSGKTTALRLIAGFERPTSGRILIDGVDVTDVPAYQRDVNTVFQSYALFPHMTVRENVEYPLKMRGVAREERKKRALDALGMVEMGSFEARYPHQLSGGQRQRIGLARAFVGRPKIMLLDEPLSALDLNLRHQMQHLLVELQRELGLTFVYVTHDQGEALSMSNRVAVVSEGKLQQLGPPQDIYYAPQNQFISQFIGKSNFFPIEVSGSVAKRFGLIGDQRFPVGNECRSGAARLCMRYEAVSISPKGAHVSDTVNLPGTISDVLFLGSNIEVKVICQQYEIIAILPSSREILFRPSQEVTVSFDPAKGHMFNV